MIVLSHASDRHTAFAVDSTLPKSFQSHSSGGHAPGLSTKTNSSEAPGLFQSPSHRGGRAPPITLEVYVLHDNGFNPRLIGEGARPWPMKFGTTDVP